MGTYQNGMGNTVSSQVSSGLQDKMANPNTTIQMAQQSAQSAQEFSLWVTEQATTLAKMKVFATMAKNVNDQGWAKGGYWKKGIIMTKSVTTSPYAGAVAVDNTLNNSSVGNDPDNIDAFNNAFNNALGKNNALHQQTMAMSDKSGADALATATVQKDQGQNLQLMDIFISLTKKSNENAQSAL
jgi:hypothetical protein